MRIETLTVVGVGLLGGSVALAARRRDAAARIVGVDQRSEVLDRIRELGLVDEATPHLGEGAHQADLLICCTPVDQIAGQILDAGRCCRPGRC